MLKRLTIAVALLAGLAGGFYAGFAPTVSGQTATVTRRTVFDVRTYGARGDGATNDATAINAAITAANAQGTGGVVYFPPGDYRAAAKIVGKSNVTLSGYGAKITCGIAGLFTPVIHLSGVSNVVIEGLEVDGRKADFASATEHKHGIQIDAGSSRVMLRDLYLHDHKGDGLYIGAGDGLTFVENVRADNVWCDANHRQGMSITAGRHLTFTHCLFTRTSGTAPQAGVDIEPNLAATVCENIGFDYCDFSFNAGQGLLIDWQTTTPAQKGVRVTNSYLHHNTLSGIAADQPKGLLAENNEIYSNGERGIVVTDNSRGVQLLDNRIYLNGLQGIYVLGQFNTKFFTGLKVTGNHVYDNSATTPNAVDGVRIDWALGPAGGCSGAIIEGNHIGNQDTANQRRGLTTDGATQMTNTIISNNVLLGNASGAVILLDEAATRRVRGNAGLADN